MGSCGLRFACVLVWLGVASGAAFGAPPAPDAAQISDILKELSAITGFRVHRQVPYQSITREQVRAYLDKELKHSVDPKETRAEESMMRLFGFVGADFDLRATMIDLLTEQAAAFYDNKQRKLFISDWTGDSLRAEALVHELAHALADQSYSINKYLNDAPDNSEQALARETVVEGQASWLADEYAARKSGSRVQRAVASPDETAYPVFGRAPLYLQTTMLFPYSQGALFQRSVFVRDGQAGFSRIFEQPPTSTAQILHPDLYYAGTVWTVPVLPATRKGMKAYMRGAFGELDMRILLRQFAGNEISERLSANLVGGTFRIDENRKDHRQVLLFATQWSDAGNAEDFLRRYADRVLHGKWKSLEETTDAPGRFTGKSESGYFRVERRGDLVLAEEGFADPL